jgi:uncharacterized protein YbcI
VDQTSGPPEDDAAGLIEAGAGRAGVADSGSVRAALANAMVGLKAKYYGKGPTRARAYINDRHVFVVMEGGLTPHEAVLIADGKEEEVRHYRLSFEASMRDTARRAVAEIVGRDVVEYQSQIVFDPAYTLEWFILADAS